MSMIFVENYVFGEEWFHSAGVKRVDTRTKEARAEALAKGETLKPEAWPVTLQLYIRSPDDALRVLNFQSRSGEEGTVDLFLDVLRQLEPPTLASPEKLKQYKDFLMEDLQIQAKPGKENKNGQRTNQGNDGGGVREDDGSGAPACGRATRPHPNCLPSSA